MSILFVLLTFLLFITISYLRGERGEAEARIKEFQPPLGAPVPLMVRENGFDVPKGYCFHPGHTWVLDEGRQNARVGLDTFASTLLGKVDRIEVTGLNRWVRQGQKLWSVTRGDLTADMVSPVEGVITAVNAEVLRDPGLLMKDPYGEGWIAVIMSPDLGTDLRNLLKGPLVRPWMQTALERLGELSSQSAGGFVQDGGFPVAGLLSQVEPGIRRQLVKEFFLT